LDFQIAVHSGIFSYLWFGMNCCVLCNVKYSLLCWWRFQPSGILCRVDWLIGTVVSEEFAGPVIKVVQQEWLGLPWRWRQQISLKRYQLCTSLHGVIPKNFGIVAIISLQKAVAFVSIKFMLIPDQGNGQAFNCMKGDHILKAFMSLSGRKV
jgi:hypothetical protein